jgi:hypothetical protein
MGAFSLVQSGTGGVAFKDEPSSGVMSVVGALHWNVNRAPTNVAIVGTLPANAKLLAIYVHVPVVSNAATTANVSIGLNGGSATFFTAAQDVKTSIGNNVQTITANWAVSTAQQVVNCTYTETGAASTAGTITATMLYVVL